ncbi:MAG TPA: patatin-like phospholipase family protein [Steroidobacteraceae bacterium]|jgi:NTE family protein
MRKPRRAAITSSLCLFAALHAALAADSPQPPNNAPTRPRIGLVLGGGGAKGGAHIGVIKVLEEMRIPVDCIAGTSMGALVGAAYATGMSSQELETFVTAVDWRDILQSAPRQSIPVNRKSRDLVFPLGLEVGVKDGSLALPGGLIPTHKIEALFRHIVGDAGPISDFNDLPIPFRAVATDIESGQMTVFDRGDLAQAMRASMAVPGAFAPVNYNGRLQADGMLVRNLPIDVARQTCADVVIAVPVGNPGPTQKNLKGLVAIAGQALNVAIDANEKVQLATLTDKDVTIRVTLKDITSADFDKIPASIPIGEAAAREQIAALSRYSLSPSAYAAWRENLIKVAKRGTIRIDEVRLAGFITTNPKIMRTFIRTAPGDIFDPNKSDQDADRLVARGDFTTVSYELTNENGRNILTYVAKEKDYGPNYLLFDGNLSTDFKGNTGWGLRIDYNMRWLNSLGGEFRTDFQLGRPNVLAAEFYQPLDIHQRFFVAPSVLAYQQLLYLYQGDTIVAQLDSRRYGGEFDAGVALASWGEFRLGLLRASANGRLNVANPEVPDPGNSELGGAVTKFTFDTQDLRLFPTSGSYGSLRGYYSTTSLGATQDYETGAINWSSTFSLGRNVWTIIARGGSDFGSHAPYYDQFTEGGLFNFSGYQINELIGREYVFGAVQFRRAVAYLSESLGTAVYVGATVEAGNVYERLDGTRSTGALLGGSLYLGVRSKLGPVYFAYGQSEGGRRALYLYLGSAIDAAGQFH